MNFIENLFHVAPDDGSGLLESAIVLAVVVFLVLHIIRSNDFKKHLPRTFKAVGTFFSD